MKYIRGPIQKRFWAKVDFNGYPRYEKRCWLWQGGVAGKGYGTVRVGSRMDGAHRVAWQLANGLIPAGAHVLHHCDTPACVRPSHLFLGTNVENIADRVAKGRSSTPCAKLTREEIAEIRAADTSVRGSQSRLAERYAVSRSTISDVRAGKRW